MMPCSQARLWERRRVCSCRPRRQVAGSVTLGRAGRGSHGGCAYEVPGYAAATGVVRGPLFGLVLFKHVLSGIAAAAGVHMSGKPRPRPDARR